MLERDIEKHCRELIEALGGVCFKFTSPGCQGVPDRICIVNGRVIFIEFKQPGKRARKKQTYEIERIKSAGGEAYVCTSYEQFVEIIDPRRNAPLSEASIG
jgi:hypothetical protein